MPGLKGTADDKWVAVSFYASVFVVMTQGVQCAVLTVLMMILGIPEQVTLRLS